MGSFSNTCGLSGTEIGYGNEKSRLIFIAEKKSGICRGCNCYPTDLWYPISFALPVNYDDYGTYEIDEESIEWKGFRYFIAFEVYKKAELERMQAEVEAGVEHTYFHGLRAGKDITEEQVMEMTPEKVFELIHEGKLFLSDGARVDKFAITDRVWKEWVVAPYSFDSDGDVFDIKSVTKEIRKEINDYAKRHVEVHVECAPDATKEQVASFRKSMKAQAMFCKGKYNYDIMDHDYPWKQVCEKNYNRTLKAKCELKMLVTKMDIIGKMFHPQMTSGGVDHMLNDFHKVCANVAKDKHNERQLDMGYPENVIK